MKVPIAWGQFFGRYMVDFVRFRNVVLCCWQGSAPSALDEQYCRFHRWGTYGEPDPKTDTARFSCASGHCQRDRRLYDDRWYRCIQCPNRRRFERHPPIHQR